MTKSDLFRASLTYHPAPFVTLEDKLREGYTRENDVHVAGIFGLGIFSRHCERREAILLFMTVKYEIASLRSQ